MPERMIFRPAWRLWWLLLVSLSGCGDAALPALDVQPVSGRVKLADDTILQQGIVELRSQTRQDISINAVIKDGTFTLVTLSSAGKDNGVPPGTYDVRITAGGMSVQGDTAPPAPVTLNAPLTIAPGQTEIELTLP